MTSYIENLHQAQESMIVAVMDVFAEINALRRENDDLKAAINRQYAANAANADDAPNGRFAMADIIALKKGRAEILNDCLYSWKECRAWRDESGEIEFTGFDAWFNEKLRKVPDYMSKADFLKYFAEGLSDLYENEKAKALEYLQEEEGKRNEEE